MKVSNFNAKYSFSNKILFLQEMKLLEDDATLYKMIGPILVKQDLAEAKQNVDKRIEYITREM